MLKIKDKKYPEGFSDLLPEGICGITSHNTLLDLYGSNTEKTLKKKYKWKTLLEIPYPEKHKVVSQPQVSKSIPKALKGKTLGMNIDYSTLSIPDEVRQVDLTNVVEVAEDFLETISNKTESLTKDMSEMILTKIAPLILSYESSINYVAAIMQDGFGIEFEDDPSIKEGIKDIAKLAMFDYAINQLSLSADKKTLILNTFIEKSIEASVTRMEDLNRKSHAVNQVKQLEAIIASRSSGKSTVSSPEKGDKNV